jgi:Domain of unknown function (DUF4252)
MKTRIIVPVWVLLVAAPGVLLAQGARLQLGHLERLNSLAAESVDVTVDPSMLKMAAAFMSDEGEQGVVKDMLKDVTGIYVRSFEFDREDAYSADDVNVVRKQLGGPGWSRLVSVDSKHQREIVEVYSWRDGNKPGGLAVLVAEPTELTVVNIVGPFDVAKLAALAGNFGIPRIRLTDREDTRK